MDNKTAVLQQIAKHGILPLYYHDDIDVSVDVLKALRRGGIRAVEYADRGTTAFENFKQLRAVCDREFPDVHLGIGTIKSRETAQRYVDAGSDFLVCPGLVESVAEVASGHDILWVPGCMTPSEIIRAEELGAVLVKLYPLNTLGPPYFEALRAVFPDLLFMPTGGIEVDDETVTGWIQAGVCALGGSKLITKPILADRLYDELTNNTHHVLELIQSVRSNSTTTNQSFLDRIAALTGADIG